MPTFSDRFIENLKPLSARYDRIEARGFSVRVFPGGTKTFQLRYQFEGKTRRISLGNYPGTTLKMAREALERLRACLDRGVDPIAFQEEQAAIAVREAEEGIRIAEEVAEAAQREAQSTTVAQLVDEYIEKWAKPRKRTWSEDYRMLHKDVVPAWGERKAKEITRRDVLTLLESIVDRGAGIMANRTLEVVRRMFNYAIEQTLLETSPCARVRVPAQEKQRDRVLTEDEIRTFWNGLAKAGMSEGSRMALRFLLLTAQRKSEVIEAPWAEFDLVGGWWTIPSGRAKNKASHRIPLSAGALELLKRAKELSGDSQWVFPSPLYADRHMGPTAIDHAMHRALPTIGLIDATPHDLRRTAASHMTGSGIPRLTITKILNHAEPGVTAVYDRHSYDREKRQALDAWGRRLEEIIAGLGYSNVIEFNRQLTG